MDSLKDILKDSEIGKKLPAYRFQDTCLEIISLANIQKSDQGLVWKLWIKAGYPAIDSLLGEIKAGEVKNPVIYIKYLLKK